jgi:hypothetical protein
MYRRLRRSLVDVAIRLAPSRSLNPAGGCCRRDFVAISPCAARASVGALRQRIRTSGTTTLRGRALRRRSGCVRAGRPARYGILNRRRRRGRASSGSKLAVPLAANTVAYISSTIFSEFVCFNTPFALNASVLLVKAVSEDFGACLFRCVLMGPLREHSFEL